MQIVEYKKPFITKNSLKDEEKYIEMHLSDKF